MSEVRKTTTGPTSHRHRVGTCPACREYLWAEVDVLVTVHPPTITAEGKAVVSVYPECVAMRLSHECSTSTEVDAS